MKKIIALLLALGLLLGLGGCGFAASEPDPEAALLRVQPLEGEPKEPDTRGLKHYKLDNGISFYATGGMREIEVDGMAVNMKNNYFVVMVIEESKKGTILEDMDLESYGAMLAQNNGLEPFTLDPYGNYATVNIANVYESEDLFFYYVTIRETENSIWLIQIACPDELAASNMDQMAQWSASFDFPEGSY